MKKTRREIAGDPQKGLDRADKMLNKGLSGFLTKAFMGKDAVAGFNQTLAMGQNALDMQKSAQELAGIGRDAAALVTGVRDTGMTINQDPVVILQLKVTPEGGEPFDAAVQAYVSRVAVPRAGDVITVRYDPDDRNRIAVV